MTDDRVFKQSDLNEDSTVQEKADWINRLNKSGYAGINGFGNIVDRREFPFATPVQANSKFGVVEPKKLKFK